MTDEHEPTTALTTQPPPPPTSAVMLWGTNDPRAMTARMGEIADAMKAVIEDRHLYTDIGDRRYVNAEGWALVGTMIGVFPQTVSTEIIEEGHLPELIIERRRRDGSTYTVRYPAFSGPLTYRAVVQLITRDGGSLGGSVAICSRREEQWRDRDDNQLSSMAQTRAAAKSYRMSFGFIMPMSGYQPTPAEEIIDTTASARAEDSDPQPPRRAQQSAARPARQQQRAAGRGQPTRPEDIRDVGGLLWWARGFLADHDRANGTQNIFDLFGVGTAVELRERTNGDFQSAAAYVIAQVQGPPQPPTPSAADELTPEQRAIYDDVISAGSSHEDAMLLARDEGDDVEEEQDADGDDPERAGGATESEPAAGESRAIETTVVEGAASAGDAAPA